MPSDSLGDALPDRVARLRVPRRAGTWSPRSAVRSKERALALAKPETAIVRARLQIPQSRPSPLRVRFLDTQTAADKRPVTSDTKHVTGRM